MVTGIKTIKAKGKKREKLWKYQSSACDLVNVVCDRLFKVGSDMKHVALETGYIKFLHLY